MGSKLLAMVIAAFVLGSSLGGVMWRFGGIYVEPIFGPIKHFNSYAELKSFLNSTAYKSGGIYTLDGTMAATSTQNSEITDYSTTNIQVAGVDEADTVKSDGKYVYVVAGRSIFIVRASPVENAGLVSKLSFNSTVIGIFVNGDRLVAFLGGYNYYGYGDVRIMTTSLIYPYSSSTSIAVYDVSNRTRPVLSQNVTFDGNYVNSRMIGDYIYVVVSKYASLVNGEVKLPTVTYDGHTTTIPAYNIYYTNSSEYCRAFTTIATLNTQVKQEPHYETLLLGAASNIYVSQKNLYITVLNGRGDTDIHKIAINAGSVTYVASGSVPGSILNQYSMDEYNGYFRAATTKWTATQTNNVYVLDENMRTTGKLENIAAGENIHSARFMGGRCYLVTFQKIDPLFVIDLANPSSPRVLGELQIPGYSDYLHPYDDMHLIGVGKETVPSDSPYFSWYQGIKVALFDVSNVSAPREVSKLTIGDRGTSSPVLSDPKAFLFSAQKNLLVLPILLARIDASSYPQGVPSSAYGSYVWQGAYVLNASLTGLSVRGTVTHMGNITGSNGSLYPLYTSYDYSVKRTLYIGNVLYTVSDKMVKLNSLDTLAEIKAIQLS